MALLGSGIDPSLFRQDFGGFADAARIDASAIMNLGNQIGDATKDYFKKQGDEKKSLKSSQALIEAALTLFPEDAAYYQGIQAKLKDENEPISDRAAIGAQIGELINLQVGNRKEQSDRSFKERELGLREQESALDRQIAEINMGQAVKKIDREDNQFAMDELTKQTIGPGLLDSVLAMSPPAVKEDVTQKLAAGEYDDAEKFSLANSIMGLLPKKDREAAPAVQDVPVPGGTQKMQWDDSTRSWVPIQTGAVEVILPEGVSAPMDGSVLPPKPGTDGYGLETENIPGLPPINGYPPVGFTPSPPPAGALTENQKIEIEKAKKKETKELGDSVAKSENLIRKLDQLEKHPGFNGLFGVGIGAGMIPGTDASDAKTVFNQIKGSGFLEAVQALKGMGALTEIEGQKATDAFLGLDPKMSEESARRQIQEIKNSVREGMKRAQGIINATENQQEAQKTPAQLGNDILMGLPKR